MVQKNVEARCSLPGNFKKKMMKKYTFVPSAQIAARLCGLILAIFGCVPTVSDAQTPVTPVAKVDLTRYAGQWFEVAAIPQFFQRECVRDTSATYAKAEDGNVSVLNKCATESGDAKIAQGRARVVNAVSNAQLEVTFLSVFGQWLFWVGGDYWVIGLEDDYRWAIVGHPSRKYAWVLSRTAALEPAQWTRVREVLKTNSYDLCALQISPQTAGLRERKPLCEMPG